MNLLNLQKKEDRLNKVYDSDGEQAPKILNGTLFSVHLWKSRNISSIKKIWSVGSDPTNQCEK